MGYAQWLVDRRFSEKWLIRIILFAGCSDGFSTCSSLFTMKWSFVSAFHAMHLLVTTLVLDMYYDLCMLLSFLNFCFAIVWIVWRYKRSSLAGKGDNYLSFKLYFFIRQVKWTIDKLTWNCWLTLTLPAEGVYCY